MILGRFGIPGVCESRGHLEGRRVTRSLSAVPAQSFENSEGQVVVGILWEFVLLRCAQSCQMQRMPRELEIDDTKKINYLQTSKSSNQLYV
jgi:hypothetical protein